MKIVSARSLAILLLGMLFAQLPGPVHVLAQGPQPAPSVARQVDSPSALPAAITAALGRAAATVAEVEKALQHLSEVGGDLGDLRAKVEDVLDSTAESTETLQPRLAAIKSQIEKLGPAPAKEGPAEAAEMAAERARLLALAAAYDSAIKTSELTGVRARQLIERITVLRHALFTKNLMERLPSPLAPSVWREIASGASGVQSQLAAWAVHWWDRARATQEQLALLLGGAVFLFAALKLAFRRVTNRRRQRGEPPLPTFFERAVSAFWVAALRLLPVLVAGFLLYIGMDALGLLADNPWGRLVPTLLKWVFVFAAISVFVAAVLAPSAPQWRLVPLADRPARRIEWLLSAIAAVYALDGVLTDVSRAFLVPLPLSVAQSVATSLAFAALLIGLLLTPFTPQGIAATETFPRNRPRWLKLPLWIVAMGIVIAALMGHVALARFAVQQILVSGIVVLVSWLGYLAIRAFTRELTQQSRALGNLMEHRFGLDAPRREQLARLTEAALTLVLAICALPFLLLQWGFAPSDIRDWLTSLLFGFEVGQFRISLVRILAGILLFIALLFATRLIQRWMRERMAQSRMDASIANSIETVVGYAGIAVAALVAVSYAGFDFSNLAIVAGALSLGIGFGLQSIVNNFVSGLILLIERPIKVGDRLIIGDQQGHVRRISVRATEVETFDRVSLIIPNSELITGRVFNWTHRDPHAAFNVKVGVSYDADPERVVAILLKCAADHPQVLRVPPPSAVLESFGDSALLFNLRVTLPDVGIHIGVQSDLRIAIFKALRSAGIEIPFNQLDVSLRDLETMRRYLGEVLDRQPSSGAGRRGDGADSSQTVAVKQGPTTHTDG